MRPRGVEAKVTRAGCPEIDITRLFEPDVVMQEQVRVKTLPNTPERKLCQAVFVSALHAMATYPRDHVLHREAREWIELDSSAIMSFDWICGLFGLDTDATREAIMQHGGQKIPREYPASVRSSIRVGPYVNDSRMKIVSVARGKSWHQDLD